ncbi:MAG: hypothetical protein NT086_19900 [Proteobacteria bacterium]|nr:hypothetical protein [Pseudomonadota bacterium]
MKDIVLKFPSRALAFSLAQAAGLTSKDQEGKAVLTAFTANYGIFITGVITQNFPLGSDMKPIKPPITLDGWWVRVRVLSGPDLPPEFLPYITEERPPGLWAIA